jgi:hypothetical protein
MKLLIWSIGLALLLGFMANYHPSVPSSASLTEAAEDGDVRNITVRVTGVRQQGQLFFTEVADGANRAVVLLETRYVPGTSLNIPARVNDRGGGDYVLSPTDTEQVSITHVASTYVERVTDGRLVRDSAGRSLLIPAGYFLIDQDLYDQGRIKIGGMIFRMKCQDWVKQDHDVVGYLDGNHVFNITGYEP